VFVLVNVNVDEDDVQLKQGWKDKDNKKELRCRGAKLPGTLSHQIMSGFNLKYITTQTITIFVVS